MIFLKILNALLILSGFYFSYKFYVNSKQIDKKIQDAKSSYQHHLISDFKRERDKLNKQHMSKLQILFVTTYTLTLVAYAVLPVLPYLIKMSEIN